MFKWPQQTQSGKSYGINVKRKKCQYEMTKYSTEDIHFNNMSILHSEDSLHMALFTLHKWVSKTVGMRHSNLDYRGGDGLLSNINIDVAVHLVRKKDGWLSASSLRGVSVLSRPALADVLKPLFQHLKARPSSRIEIPALFHDVVHHLRTAVGTIHLVPFFHPRNDLF